MPTETTAPATSPGKGNEGQPPAATAPPPNANPDRLDSLTRIVSPIGWVALLTIVLLILVALAWGFLGRLPRTVHGTGILLRGGVMESVVSPGEGQLMELMVELNERIGKGQQIAKVYQPTLAAQIANQELVVKDLRQRYNETRQAYSAQLESQLDFLSQQESSVRVSIKDYKEQRQSVQKVVDAQTKLLARGLIPMTTLLQSQTQLDSVTLNILQAENQLQQIETNRIQAKSTAQQSIDQAQISLQQAESQLANYQAEFAQDAKVISPHAGKVVSIDAAIGQNLQAGTPVVSLERHWEPMQALLFFPSGKGKEIDPGMKLRIAPESARVDQFGYILGRVERVADVPASQNSMMAVLSNKDLVDSISSSGPVLEVFGSLETEAKTPSGFRWSSSQGPPFEITSGTICKAQAITEELRPIELVIPFLKKFFGIAQ